MRLEQRIKKVIKPVEDDLGDLTDLVVQICNAGGIDPGSFTPADATDFLPLIETMLHEGI